MIRLKTDVLQQTGEGQFYAHNSFLTSSRMGEPGYRLAVGRHLFRGYPKDRPRSAHRPAAARSAHRRAVGRARATGDGEQQFPVPRPGSGVLLSVFRIGLERADVLHPPRPGEIRQRLWHADFDELERLRTAGHQEQARRHRSGCQRRLSRQARLGRRRRRSPTASATTSSAFPGRPADVRLLGHPRQRPRQPRRRSFRLGAGKNQPLPPLRAASPGHARRVSTFGRVGLDQRPQLPAKLLRAGMGRTQGPNDRRRTQADSRKPSMEPLCRRAAG